MCVTERLPNGHNSKRQGRMLPTIGTAKTFVHDMLSSLDVKTINHISYAILTILCAVMVFWILIFPSSVWYEHSPNHRKLLRAYFHLLAGMRNEEVGAVNSDLITKYSGQYLVQVTHILPGAVWAAIIPFQLNTAFRKNHRTLHRYVGYGFVGSALLLGTGVFIIIYKGLLFENSFPDLPPKQFSAAPALIMLMIYFLGTVLTASYYVTISNPKQYNSHAIWIARHVASGIWISLQRMLLGSPLFNRPPMTREQQRSAFGNAGFLSIAITIVSCEILIFVWNSELRATKVNECKKDL
jgi:hypothetical protein